LIQALCETGVLQQAGGHRLVVAPKKRSFAPNTLGDTVIRKAREAKKCGQSGSMGQFVRTATSDSEVNKRLAIALAATRSNGLPSFYGDMRQRWRQRLAGAK
jgi:hypothetical protein